MTVYTLSSGSKGNSIFIKDGQCEILIDAGISARATESALREAGSSLKNISAIFITHEHADHIGGLEIISKKHGIPVHMTAPSAGRIRRGGCLDSVLKIHEPCYSVTVGSLEVSSFLSSHDSAMCVGYTVSSKDGTLGVATDLGYVSKDAFARLSGCDSVIIESNHDKKMLREGGYPYELKKRIMSDRGHLSNEDCARCVAALADCGVRNFILAHLSEENNIPSLALGECRRALDGGGHPEASVTVAAASAVTRFI